MTKLEMPSRDIPVEPTNLSPSLAAMSAILITPQQYSRIMGDAVLSINEQCKGVQRYIGK